MANGNFLAERSNSEKHPNRRLFAKYKRNWESGSHQEDCYPICTQIYGNTSMLSSTLCLPATSVKLHRNSIPRWEKMLDGSTSIRLILPPRYRAPKSLYRWRSKTNGLTGYILNSRA